MPPLTVAELVAALEEGRRFDYRFFWSHRARKGAIRDACFSQWWPCRFQIGEQTYTSAEQWMMASKARLFGDSRTLEEMLATDEPGEVKALGRGVRDFDEERWGAVCFDVVTVGNVAKFGQNGALRKHLEKTGDAVLVEASPTDLIWGIGFTREAPEAADPRRWRGKSMLGFALMRARGILRGEIEGPDFCAGYWPGSGRD